MKRFLSLALALVLTLALAGCGAKAPAQPEKPDPDPAPAAGEPVQTGLFASKFSPARRATSITATTCPRAMTAAANFP